MKRAYLFIAFVACTTALVFGRGNPLSPSAETSVTVGGKAIKIDYSAPSVRGRKIFGGKEAFDHVWRAGADDATAFHTDADLDLNGLKVPKGNYTLYIYLNEKQWKLIVNKQTGQWGTEYDEKQDLGRVPMMMSKPTAPIEKMKITLASAGGSKGTLEVAWDNTVAKVPFTAE